METLDVPPTYPQYAVAGATNADYNISLTHVANHEPLTGCTSIDTTYSTSAESGLEVDMEMCESAASLVPPCKPSLTRRHTLTGMTGIVNPECMLRNVGGPSIDSGNSMELPSESPSIDSSLDYTDYTNTLDLCNSMNNSNLNFQGTLNFLGQPCQLNESSLPLHSQTNPELEGYSTDLPRQNTRSPIHFREGRRASDGLVCQDVIAFRQKLKDGMKAGGMLELRQEHNQLMESHSSELDSNIPSEPPVKIPLGKRMSLPTSSIDLPPHKLLEMKKSIQLNQHLAASQDMHEVSSPLALRPYEPVQMLTFGNSCSLQRQVHNRSVLSMRKQGFKQQSALHQQFQQMHIEQTSLVTTGVANMGRGSKHPPVARQPSYKLAQQQPVMPPVTLQGNDGVPTLPWPLTMDNTNFLMPLAAAGSSTNSGPILSSPAVPASATPVQHNAQQQQMDSLFQPSRYTVGH